MFAHSGEIKRSMKMLLSRAFVLGLLLSTSVALAQDWDSVSFVRHSEIQAVNADGSTAFSGGFPLRIIGVVLNDTEDWLDPTAAYDPDYHLFQMGGEAEFYVQAVDLDGTEWDTDTTSDFDDFGGTSCWMGQNYGNHIMHQDPYYSYTDAEWTAELGRLNLYGGDGVTDPIRAGDLVEVRARAGLHYSGKYNVNEQHSTSTDNDFEIVRLCSCFGLPNPTPLFLSDLKDTADTFIFDSTRQTGPERYQSERVRLSKLYLTGSASWAPDSDITATDAYGLRTFNIHLGLDESFDGTPLVSPGGQFNAMGILDQKATNGQLSVDGYQLLVMDAFDIHPTPPHPVDINGDYVINLDDFIILKQNFGLASASHEQGDLNEDGTVNLDDFIILKQNYGWDGR